MISPQLVMGNVVCDAVTRVLCPLVALRGLILPGFAHSHY